MSILPANKRLVRRTSRKAQRPATSTPEPGPRVSPGERIQWLLWRRNYALDEAQAVLTRLQLGEPASSCPDLRPEDVVHVQALVDGRYQELRLD